MLQPKLKVIIFCNLRLIYHFDLPKLDILAMCLILSRSQHIIALFMYRRRAHFDSCPTEATFT